MAQPVIRLSKSTISKEEIDAVSQTMAQEFLGMGQQVQMFEDDLVSFLGGEPSLCTSNTGTSALQMGIQSLGLKPGDEILIPSLTYVASFQAASAAGVFPVPTDVEINTGLICLESAKKLLTNKTKALMYVHYASEFSNIEEVQQFCQENELYLIADAAHSFGCTYQNKPIAQFADITCFSFDGIKNITSAEGGCLVSYKHTEAIELAKDLRLLGVEKDTEKRYQGTRSWDFDVKHQGWRYHLSEINATIGRVQLKKFQSDFSKIRKNLVTHYNNRIKEVDSIIIPLSAEYKGKAEVTKHIYPVRVLNGKRDQLKEHLEANNIQSGVHYKPNHQLTKYKSQGLPNAERLGSELLTLPLHADLLVSDIDRIISTINDFKD